MAGRAAAASSLLGRSCRALLPLFPFGVYVSDDLASLHVVEDGSMEPALKAGDVVFVRRADVFPRRLWDDLAGSAAASEGDGGVGRGEGLDAAGSAVDGLRVMALDASCGRPVGDRWAGRTYLSPPLLYRPGQAVLVRRPDASRYPSSEVCVRRVVGLGGQDVRVSERTPGGAGRRRGDRVEGVPPYAVWAESDRGDGSEGEGADSRAYGPVCKNGAVGVVEAVVWPPWRVGRVGVVEPEARSWWPR